MFTRTPATWILTESLPSSGLGFSMQGPEIMDKIFETNSSFHVKKAHYGKSSIFIFHEFFASIDKIFIWGIRLDTKL